MPEIQNIKPFPVWVDERARDTPDKVYAIIPKTHSLQDGYKDFTYAQLAAAVDKMSWWLDRELGKAQGFETVAYIGESDLRYTILYIAAQKTQRQVLFPLNQNTRQAQLNLLAASSCKVLIASKTLLRVWHALRPGVEESMIKTMPDFDEFLECGSIENYPFSRTWEETKDNPILALQTSGSTGTPKLISYTNHMMSVLLPGESTDLILNSRQICPIAPSWILGLVMHLHIPMYFGTIPILLPADAPMPMTADYMDRVHTSVDADGGIYVPSLLKELSKNEKYIDHMRHMKTISFGGAPLDRNVGDLLSSFAHVQPVMGSTEVGSYGLNPSPKEDWMYYNFSLETGFRFLPFQDDLYESVVVKHRDPEKAEKQMVFFVFPELDVYHTKDLWTKHPTKEGLWMYSGRTDDFVKLSTLTKFNATHIEELVLRDGRVRGCVMGGEGREVPFLLIEPEDGGMSETEIRDQMWPLIQEVNARVSNMIALEKDMVFFTAPGKPLKRVLGKGTTNRRATIEEYEGEIEELYKRRGGKVNGSGDSQ